MVPPVHHRILTLDSPVQGVVGAITITSTERVNNWNRKILKRLKTLVNNSNETTLNKSVEDYYRWVKDQVTCLKERHLLREKISDHLYCLHLSYVRLQDQELIRTSSYLNTMEKLLCLVCNLELEIVSLTKHSDVASVAQPIINMLHLFLHDELTRILHVLLKLSERYLNQQPYKLIMNIVYKYFLVTVPVINTADLNFCLHYLIYQKWKKTKPESAHSGMDKFMFFTFNKTPNSIKESRLLRKILKPSSNETINCIDNYVNSVEAKITRYFKYFEQTEEIVNCSALETETSKKSKNEDPYEIEFVQSTLYIKTLTLRNNISDSNSLISIVSKRDDVVVIDDDDEDSDVEIVPMVQNNESIAVIEPIENLQIQSTNTDLLDTVKATDASKLTPLFDSINIAGIKNLNIEKEDFSFSGWSSKNKDTPEMNRELIKCITSILEDLCTKARHSDKEFTIPGILDTVSKQFSCQEKLDTKFQKEENSCNTDGNKSIKIRSEMVSEFITQSDEIPQGQIIDEELSSKIVLKELQNPEIGPKEIHTNEVQTNETSCNYCVCQHSAAKKVNDLNPNTKETDPGLKSNHRSIEIQTDNGITVTNVYNFRGVLETPPSDLENCISPPNNSFTFITPITDVVKEDNVHCLSEIYSEAGGITLKFGDSATQVYPDQLGIIQEINQEGLKKAEDESYDDFNYGASTSASINNEYVANYNTESPLVIINSSAIGIDDCLKLHVLEAESDDTYGVAAAATNNTDGNNRLELSGSSVNNSRLRDSSPPAYEVISTQGLKKHLKEVKKKKCTGILKNSSLHVNEGDDANNLGNGSQQGTSSLLHLRSAISTRASSKRKHIIPDELELPPKCKKVNFAESDVVVHIPKEQQRRIPHAVAEQAKDSMCIHNIHKQDNKLIYLEPCIPVKIVSFTKFLEEQKLRQIITYNKNVNNMFINKSLTLKDELPTSSIQRVDYKKYQKSNESSNASSKYSTITFHASNETGFTRKRPYGDYSKNDATKITQPSIKSETLYEDVLRNQPRVVLTLRPVDVLLKSPKYRMADSGYPG